MTVFYKYHGTGNDFVVFDTMERGEPFLDPSQVEEICRRHTGVGADGVIFACPPQGGGDARMRIFNADGTEAEMCGNGIRCLAKFLYERVGLVKERMFIETGAGTRELSLRVTGGIVNSVDVDMGFPEFVSADIPGGGADGPVRTVIGLPQGGEVISFCLSMGNPHCVVFVPRVEETPVDLWGPFLERHPLFPNRINVEFVEVVDERHLKIRVWERGVGETQACGTGACAAFVTALSLGKGSPSMEVILPGGTLVISADEGGHVHLTGPAVEVFRGEISPGWLEHGFGR